MRMHLEYSEGLGAYLRRTEENGIDPIVTVLSGDKSFKGKLSRRVLSDYSSYYITVPSRSPMRYTFRPDDKVYAEDEFLGSVRESRTRSSCFS